MYRHQEQVREFMKKFNQETPYRLTIPSSEIRILRVRLLLEEVLEFAEASGIEVFLQMPETQYVFGFSVKIDINRLSLESRNDCTNLKEMADALTDIQYVNDGAAVACGIDLEPCAEEVHRSNMTKLWPYCKWDDRFLTEEELVPNQFHRHQREGYNYHREGGCIDYRANVNNVGKVLKPATYSPADLGKVLGL